MQRMFFLLSAIIVIVTFISSPSYSINLYNHSGYPNYAPPDPIPGERTTFNYLIGCEGDGCTVGLTFQVGFIVNGSVVDTHTITVRPDEGLYGQFFWDAVCDANVEIVIDPANSIAETDETDNSWSDRIVCSEPPRPDLYIYSCSYAPAPIAEGEMITFTYNLINSGRYGEVATGPFNVGLRVGGVMIRQNRHDGMPHTEVVRDLPQGTFRWRAHCGEPFELVVDVANEVDEGDESNNIYAPSSGPRPFECVPSRLDLMIGIFDESHPGSGGVMAGSRVSFVVDPKAVRIPPPPNIRLTCGIEGGEVLYDHTFVTLPEYEPGVIWMDRATFSHRFCPVGRTFRVYCEIDPDNLHTESDETNNREVISFTTVENPLNPHLCPETEPSPPPPKPGDKKLNFAIDFIKKELRVMFIPGKVIKIASKISLSGNVLSEKVGFKGKIIKLAGLAKKTVKTFKTKKVSVTKGLPYSFTWKWLPKTSGNYIVEAVLVLANPKHDTNKADNKATMKVKLTPLKGK